MLLGFQADLGGISDEIKHLQVQNILKGVTCGAVYVWGRASVRWHENVLLALFLELDTKRLTAQIMHSQGPLPGLSTIDVPGRGNCVYDNTYPNEWH